MVCQPAQGGHGVGGQPGRCPGSEEASYEDCNRSRPGACAAAGTRPGSIIAAIITIQLPVYVPIA